MPANPVCSGILTLVRICNPRPAGYGFEIRFSNKFGGGLKIYFTGRCPVLLLAGIQSVHVVLTRPKISLQFFD